MQRLGFDDREAFLGFSRKDPERFWAEILREMDIEWFEPYTRVLDASRGPEWAQWFIGGKLNIAHNCLIDGPDADASHAFGKAKAAKPDRDFAESRG